MDIGFSSTIIAISSSLVIGSIVRLVQSQQYFGRYIIIFLAATCALIQYSTYLAYLTDAPTDSFPASMARTFFSTMFVPLLNCLFFEICRTLIKSPAKTNREEVGNEEIITNDNNKDNNNVTMSSLPTRSKYAIYTIYVAYLYTTVYVIIAIAYCVIYANSWSIDIHTGVNVDPQIYNLYEFKEYGTWGYEVFIAIELVLAYKQLRPCIKVLSIYILDLIVAGTGSTIAGLIFRDCNGSACLSSASMLNYIMVGLFGLLGLIYILYVSPRYLPSQPKRALNNPQQFFTYAPAAQQQQYYVSPQPPQMATATAVTKSSTVVNLQQQYPIVQIPQQKIPPQGQHHQQQQPIIVQLPIIQQPVNQQYPIMQIQQVPTGYYNSNTSQ